MKRHPKLNDNLDYDVAIWILGNPIQKGAYAPVYAELNRNASFPPNGVNAWVMGFGLTSTEDYEDTMVSRRLWQMILGVGLAFNLTGFNESRILQIPVSSRLVSSLLFVSIIFAKDGKRSVAPCL